MKTGKISSTIELLGKCQSEGVEVIDVNELRKQAKPLFSCKWIAYLVLGVCVPLSFFARDSGNSRCHLSTCWWCWAR